MSKPLQFYHGGREWVGKFELGKGSGSMEHGPGLYLTNGIETARHYAKGGGVVQMISINPSARLIDDVRVDISEMKAFLKCNSIRHYKSIYEDIDRCAERYESSVINLEILVKLMINYGSLTASAAIPLNEFIVSKGVDMCVFDAPVFSSHGGGPSDQWLVIYNPDVIVGKSRVNMKDFDWSEPKLPRYDVQMALSNLVELEPSAPALNQQSVAVYHPS